MQNAQKIPYNRSSYLVKDQGLTDGSPVCVSERREEVERQDQGETEEDGDGGEQWRDEEHHRGRAHQPDQARVPREVGEGRAEVGRRGQVKAETREIDAGVGKQEEDRAELSDLVEAADQKTNLHKAKSCDHGTGTVLFRWGIGYIHSSFYLIGLLFIVPLLMKDRKGPKMVSSATAWSTNSII